MRRKPCSSIDLRLAGLSRGRALGWAGAPEGALNGQRNAKVSIPLNRRFGAGIAAGGKIWHKKNPAWRDFFMLWERPAWNARRAPTSRGASNPTRKPSLPVSARSAQIAMDPGTGEPSWRMPDQTRFDDGAPLAGKQPKRGGEQPTPRPTATKPPPFAFFIPPKQTDGVAAKPQNSAPTIATRPA